ncbi:MAG: flagellar hook assembly protein FlgD [Gammaproteobacteria bacterium]
MQNPVNGVGQGIEALAINQTQKKVDNKNLGQDDFMKLMVAQLNNQDPTKPVENAEFLSQLAQFGTVNGITELQNSFSSLSSSLQSNQALQASTLVGREVLVPAKTVDFKTGAVEGAIELSGSTGELNLLIKNTSGQVVKELKLGAQSEGDVSFKWNGLDESGAAVPAGKYSISAEASIDGESKLMATQLRAKVDSVTLSGASGPLLNLAGIGSIGINEVKQVQ